MRAVISKAPKQPRLTRMAGQEYILASIVVGLRPMIISKSVKKAEQRRLTVHEPVIFPIEMQNCAAVRPQISGRFPPQELVCVANHDPEPEADWATNSMLLDDVSIWAFGVPRTIRSPDLAL